MVASTHDYGVEFALLAVEEGHCAVLDLDQEG